MNNNYYYKYLKYKQKYTDVKIKTGGVYSKSDNISGTLNKLSDFLEDKVNIKDIIYGIHNYFDIYVFESEDVEGIKYTRKGYMKDLTTKDFMQIFFNNIYKTYELLEKDKTNVSVIFDKMEDDKNDIYSYLKNIYIFKNDDESIMKINDMYTLYMKSEESSIDTAAAEDEYISDSAESNIGTQSIGKSDIGEQSIGKYDIQKNKNFFDTYCMSLNQTWNGKRKMRMMNKDDIYKIPNNDKYIFQIKYNYSSKFFNAPKLGDLNKEENKEPLKLLSLYILFVMDYTIINCMLNDQKYIQNIINMSKFNTNKILVTFFNNITENYFKKNENITKTKKITTDGKIVVEKEELYVLKDSIKDLDIFVMTNTTPELYKIITNIFSVTETPTDKYTLDKKKHKFRDITTPENKKKRDKITSTLANKSEMEKKKN